MIASAVALHEAGHAVVGVALGLPAPVLILRPHEPEWVGLACFRLHGQALDPLADAALAWAGALAEGSEPTGQDLVDLAAIEAQHGPQLIAQARELAERLLDRHEDTLERLARELDRQGSLPAYKVAGLLAPVRAASRGMLR